MPTYIVLESWTQDGIRNIKEGPKRLDKAKKALRAAGAKLKDFYMVMGRYDMVAIIEAPDDETMAKIALSIGSAGAVRSETLKAFTETEYRKIVKSPP